MTNRKGFFAPEAIPSGWWDETTQAIGWFSDDLLTDVASGGDFAGTFTDRGIGWGAASASTASITVPAGDLIYVFGGARRGSAVSKPTISDTLSLTWTEVINLEANDAATFGWLVVWSAVSTGAAVTITVSSTSAGLTGAHAVSVSGAAAIYTNAATTFDGAGDPTVTLSALSANSAVLAGLWIFAQAATPADPAGFTGLGGGNTTAPGNGTLESWQDSTAPATSVAWISGGTRTIGVAIEVFKAAASAYDLVADAGSYAVTGSAADLEYGRRIAADPAAYAVTGSAAALEYGFRIAADPGAYAVSGAAVDLELGREVIADPGSYSVAGSAADLEYGREVVADAAAYAVAGQDASLEYGFRVAADPASYAVTGSDVSLTYLAANKITADPGSYAVTGTDVALEYGFRVAADPGAYAVTGALVDLELGRRVVADPAAYAVTGADVALEYGRRIAADAGAYAVSGADVALRSTRVVVIDAGAYVVAGSDVSLVYGGPAEGGSPRKTRMMAATVGRMMIG
jgi:phage gp45-like